MRDSFTSTTELGSTLDMLRSTLLVSLACTVACSSSTDGDDGSGNVGGDSVDQCESLKGDEPQSISVRIVNQSSSPIFIYNECYAAGLDGVRIDGSSLDGWTNYTCDDYLSGNCRGMDCFGNPPLELPTGEEHVDTWSGLVHEKDSTSIPEECTNDCFNAPSVCTRAIAAEPGEYSVSVRYYSDQTTGYVTTERTFTMPTSEITVEITD